MPAANKKPIVRPRVVSRSTPEMYHVRSTAGQALRDPLTDPGGELVAVVHGQAPGLDLLAGVDGCRQLPQFRLVKNPQARKELVERTEQDGRLDVARVIHHVDGRAMSLDMLMAFDDGLDAAQRESHPHTTMRDAVQEPGVAEEQ